MSRDTMKGKELYRLMDQFERSYKTKNLQFDKVERDPKTLTHKPGNYYKNKETNNIFGAYVLGYYLGRQVNLSEKDDSLLDAFEFERKNIHDFI